MRRPHETGDDEMNHRQPGDRRMRPTPAVSLVYSDSPGRIRVLFSGTRHRNDGAFPALSCSRPEPDGRCSGVCRRCQWRDGCQHEELARLSREMDGVSARSRRGSVLMEVLEQQHVGIGSDREPTWPHWTAQATRGVVSIPRERLRALFSGRTTIPRDLIDADVAGTPSIWPALLALMLPAAVEDAARRITCPLSLGVGASASNTWPRNDPHACASASSLTLDVQPGASYCASCVPNRFDLWTALTAWCRATAGAAIGYHRSGLSGRPGSAWSRCPPTPAAAAPEEEEKS